MTRLYRRTLWQIVPVVVGGLVVALLAASSPAHAGTYTVYGCAEPDGTPTGVDGWAASSSGPSSFDANYCRQGKHWLFFMRGDVAHPNGDRSEAVFTAPGGTSIAGYTIARSARVLTSTAFDYAYTLAEGDRAVNVEYCGGAFGCGGVGDPDRPASDSNLITRAGLLGVRQLWLSVGCLSPATCAPFATDSPAKLWIHRTAVTLQDDLAPTITGTPTGALVAGGTLAGTQSVSVAASDGGGGLQTATVEIDGEPVAHGSFGTESSCRAPYTKTVPCPTSASARLAVDTGALADGSHELLVRVTDATGVNSTTWGPVPIHTANSCEVQEVSSSLRVRTWLSTKHRPALRARSLRAGYATRVALRGRVTDGGGPVADAPVCLTAATAVSGGRPIPYTYVNTRADGTFSLALGRGPSRSLGAVARGVDGSAVDAVRLRVHAAVRLSKPRRTLRNGQTLTLPGRLMGGPIPRRGAVVEFQVRRGTRWQTFGTTRAGRRGAFKLRYRFTRTSGLQRYRMRAHVPDQDGYPYLAGSSRTVNVVVRG